ncbi:hypothetical protein Stsp02_21470 [Streptomyces sp. NBRC 14336]|uniref:tetratricopeptide repeat protein n=1 Tax=Streptomyces sp. NBRC 14336 TaxID=3030992 RepID=UPI0024A3971B|nr:tetratricopeptide repeat protein [Streptomyces sp. NBRC 14336]WBO81801.1 tetratricopeptide repeat protein [Streptomyces sp. SBE_14.2]GLW46485.1 hypothetical protein Stsp02_21470 [Streptomyces sp. NBRC 14336]
MTGAVSPWGFKGTPVGRLAAELAAAKEALACGRFGDSVRSAERVLTQTAAARSAAESDEYRQRLDLLHASALTTLGRVARRGPAPDGQARFEEAAAIFSRALGAGEELRRDGLADYGTALVALGRVEEARQFVTLALERDTRVPPEAVLGVADLLGLRSEQAEADRLLRLALDAGVEDPAIAERLAGSLGKAAQPDRAADVYARAGMWYGAAGRPDEALRCFDLAVALVPDHIGAMLGRSYALHDLGRAEEALAVVGQVVQQHPESVEAHAYMAQLLGSRDQLVEAFRLLQDALARFGDVPELRATLARALLWAGSEQEALSVVKVLLEERPTDVELRRLKAHILLELDHSEAAIEILSGLLAENQAILDDRLDVIDAVIRMGELQRALNETEHALLFAPDSPELIGRRAYILHRLERPEEALAAARHATTSDSPDATALYAEGLALVRLDRKREALRPLRRLLRLRPEFLDGRLRLTELLIHQGETDEADGIVADGLRTHGEVVGLLLAQGRIAIHRRDHEAALEPLETAVRRLAEADGGETGAVGAAEAAEVYLWLGEAMRLLGRLTEACSWLERGLELRPDHGTLLGTLGQVLRAQGSAEAEERLRQAVKAEPSPSFAHAELGDLLRDEGRLVESRDVLLAATRRWPAEAWLWGTLGATHHRLRDYDAALECCDKALERNSAYAWAWALKGAVLWDIDELDRAVEAFDASLDLDPANGWAWMCRGWALELLERREEARQSFRRAVRQRSTTDHEDHAWALIGLADLLLQDADVPAARRHFQQILRALRGVDGMELAQIGWCQLRLDECEQAAREFGEALLIEEAFSPVQFDLALALLGLDPVERAVVAFAEAVVALRAVTHPGRRNFLLHVAEHDLDIVQTQPSYRTVGPEHVDVIRWMLTRDGPAAPEWRRVMEAKLLPEKYRCTLHDTDLTEAVVRKVYSDPVQVANFGYSARRGRKRDGSKDKPFTVVVECPGAESGEDAHDHEFKGVVRP